MTRNKNVIEKIAIVKDGQSCYFGYRIYNTKGVELYEDIKAPDKVKQQLIKDLDSMPNFLNLSVDNE